MRCSAYSTSRPTVRPLTVLSKLTGDWPGINWYPADTGWTCLHHAAAHGRPDLMQWLLDRGAIDRQLPLIDKTFSSKTAAKILRLIVGPRGAAERADFAEMRRWRLGRGLVL